MFARISLIAATLLILGACSPKYVLPDDASVPPREAFVVASSSLENDQRDPLVCHRVRATGSHLYSHECRRQSAIEAERARIQNDLLRPRAPAERP